MDRPSIRERASRRRRLPALLDGAGRRVVRSALERLSHGGVRLVDERGRTAFEPRAAAAATVRVVDPSFYAAVAFGGGVGVAESYMAGAWTTDDLPALIETITVNLAAMEALEGPLARLFAPVSFAAYRLDRNTRAGSRRNIVAHYDLGNDFFGLFLDPTMTYSCGIFENGADTLEAAQLEKIDRACRKLRLRKSDHLLEIGTGWGALAIHAATRYGCRVTTTTISEEQSRFAAERIRRAGLTGRVTALQTDYRDVRGEFDKIVSIEMLEAVGAENLGGYFAACSRLLKADGAALIQSIVIRDQRFRAASRRQDFLKKYIFPGSCLPSVAAILDAVSRRTDLRLWHMEDIGPHYATTLRLWRDAFLSRIDDVRAMGFDERFIRMWEYYLAYCEGAFRARHVGDVQALLTKPMCRIPPVGSEGPAT
ncbi:MAG: class I SAM-dependent methyltransferase [Phycisphaerales bacterium]|nr:class I SAM-dependent methyltransferase [Phycisphaerales bacterium]